MGFILLFFFFCLPKEKEPKRKGTQPLVPPQAGCPVLLGGKETKKETEETETGSDQGN